jgi:hypothetical protein
MADLSHVPRVWSGVVAIQVVYLQGTSSCVYILPLCNREKAALATNSCVLTGFRV